MIDEFARRLLTRAESFGLTISSREETQLAVYFNLLRRWNRTINLTALSLDPLSDQALDRLFIEPLAAVRCLQKDLELRGAAQKDTVPQQVVALSDGDTAGRWFDLGSGGGSPAIPLRIALPELRPLIMVESRTKKVAFLREAARTLELSDVSVLHARFAQLSSYAGSAALVTVRAVALDAELDVVVSELLSAHGLLVAFESSATLAPFKRLAAVSSHELLSNQSSWMHAYRLG